VDQQSRAWARALTLVVAVVIGLYAVALPASAAPTTKKYSASFSVGSTTGLQSVTVPSKATGNNTVTLLLSNRQDSQQTFGSAQLEFTGSPLPSAISAPGWKTQAAVPIPNGVRFVVISSPSGKPVAPGGSLPVSITVPGKAGTTELETEVKQSNDFKGMNNDFTLVDSPTQPLTIITVGSCAGTCSPVTDPSPINKVTANLTITASAPFTFIAGFTLDRLSCDEIPFGPFDELTNTGIRPEPFQVDTTSSAPLSKTLVLTFPKALANLVPDNGTPHHPVCAGADTAFPGSESTEGFPPGTFTHPFEGLLLDCNDPTYIGAVGNPAVLPMCVSSRARNAGKLVVTISIAQTTFDPRIW
jgi:hypothetical protein